MTCAPPDARRMAQDGFERVLKKPGWRLLKRKTNLTGKQRVRLRESDVPKEWQRPVVAPLTVERFRDYEMAAERIVGRAEDERRCYCSSGFVVMETRSNDDDEFHQVAACAESLKAWRLRDGR